MCNFLKTTLLMGALTGLLMLVGAAVGAGVYGWIGAVLGTLAMGFTAFVMNAGTWFFSDTVVLKTTGAVPASDTELGWLHDDLEELASKAGMPKPRLYLVPHEMSPNAFATGRSPRKGVVAVTAGLLRTLDRREVRAVLAHEVGHIRNRDTLISVIAATLAGVITMVAYTAQFASRTRRGNPIVMVLIALLAPLAAVVIRMMISRTREYGADRRAAQLTGDPEGLALALEGLSRGASRAPMQRNSARNVHHIINGFTGGLSRLMSTHPPIDKRVARLRRMASEMP